VVVSAGKRASNGKQVTVHECINIGCLVESINQCTNLYMIKSTSISENRKISKMLKEYGKTCILRLLRNKSKRN
jgi:hypothetical protein